MCGICELEIVKKKQNEVFFRNDFSHLYTLRRVNYSNSKHIFLSFPGQVKNNNFKK